MPGKFCNLTHCVCVCVQTTRYVDSSAPTAPPTAAANALARITVNSNCSPLISSPLFFSLFSFDLSSESVVVVVVVAAVVVAAALFR